MLIKVVICQLQVGGGISLAEKIHIFKCKPDFVCLPEYFLIPPDSDDYSSFAYNYNQNLKLLRRWSNELDTTLIGGTIIDRVDSSFHNTSYAFRRGEKIAIYRKRFPTENELRKGIAAGRKMMVFEVDGVKVGILICADALHRECFEKLGRMKADLIFVPTVSPLLADDTPSRKAERDKSIFIEGARLSGAYVIKTCGLGSIFGHNLNGRSLVAAAWGILWQVSPESEQHPRIQSLVLDIEELREFRKAAMIREVVSQIDNLK
jgi:predicted amidohydrolase